jgi:hypothetical protein
MLAKAERVSDWTAILNTQCTKFPGTRPYCGDARQRAPAEKSTRRAPMWAHRRQANRSVHAIRPLAAVLVTLIDPSAVVCWSTGIMQALLPRFPALANIKAHMKSAPTSIVGRRPQRFIRASHRKDSGMNIMTKNRSTSGNICRPQATRQVAAFQLSDSEPRIISRPYNILDSKVLAVAPD